MKKIALLFAVALIGFTACEKENEISMPVEKGEQNAEPTIKSINGTLFFETVDDFNATLEKVRDMTTEERVAWELSHNFKSFGTLSEMFYESIDFDQFGSFEDVKAFVEQHSDYLELVTDETGEVSCCIKEEDNCERYLIDANKMYFIGSEAYKYIEGTLISCSETEVAKLKSVTTLKNDASMPLTARVAIECVDKIEKISSITEMPIQAKSSSMEEISTVDKNRIRLKIETKNVQKFGDKEHGRHRRLEYRVKNQKKTLGMWFRAPRTTSYSIDFDTYDSQYIPDVEEKYWRLYRTKTNVKFAVDDYVDDDNKVSDNYKSTPEIGTANCWASNSSGCSVSIIN